MFAGPRRRCPTATATRKGNAHEDQQTNLRRRRNVEDVTSREDQVDAQRHRQQRERHIDQVRVKVAVQVAPVGNSLIVPGMIRLAGQK